MLWKIGGAAVALLAAYFLVTMYGAARFAAGKSEEFATWQLKAKDAEAARFDAFREGLARREAAQVIYHDTVTRLQPIEQRTIERVNDYARTPAGSVLCLAPDRVRGLEATRAALQANAPASDPGGAAAAVPHPAPSKE